MTPSELLLGAADLIKEMSIHFEGYHGGPDGDDRFANTAEQWTYYSVDRNVSVDARRWIAAMSPVLAPHLEAWLRETADSLRQHRREWRHPAEGGKRSTADVDDLTEQFFGPALAFSRVVLGYPEETT